MQLLQGTLIVAAALVPGFISLALALSPRSRAIRQSSLGTRVFGLLLLSFVDWLLALALYAKLPFGDHTRHCHGLAQLLAGSAPGVAGSSGETNVQILTNILTLPADVMWGIGLLLGCATLVGMICAALHRGVLLGFAINDYRLTSERLRGWTWCSFHLSRAVERTMRRFGVADLFQPLGAAHWLVVLRAARLLQRASARPHEAKVARVYVDVIQGDERKDDGKVGVLYTGTVKHLVCEIDGNVVFLLLTEAKRWSTSAKPIEDGQGGTSRSGRWKPIENSEALGLDGRNIRNISFRLIDRTELALRWPDPLPPTVDDAPPTRLAKTFAKLRSFGRWLILGPR